MCRSFRDPDGFVFTSAGRVFRRVLPQASSTVLAFLDSAVYREFVAEGHLCPGWLAAELEEAEVREDLPQGSLLVEHRPVRFLNYPSEWAPEMLHAAASLTLQLAERSLRAGFSLKDATPRNIMFEAATPVFLDLLSFAALDQPEVVWRAYAQFVQTFLYPLAAYRYAGLRPDEIFISNPDGLEPARMCRLLPAWRLCLPPWLGLVTLPAWTSDRAEGQSYRRQPARDRGEAEFVQGRLFRRCRAALRRLGGHAGKPTQASRYMETDCPYGTGSLAAKTDFVADALRRHSPARVLDLGCNTGRFSFLAAECGASVVAVDRAPDVIGLLWTRANASGAAILPLVVDIGNPTPATGWGNCEAEPFLARARGQFDCVLMLGLLHHLMVGQRVPLDRIAALLSELTTQFALLEFVSTEDRQFLQIARGRESLHDGLTQPAFEITVARRFEIVEQLSVSATRRLYLLRKRGA